MGSVTTCVGKLGRFQFVGFTVACTHINVHIYIYNIHHIRANWHSS